MGKLVDYHTHLEYGDYSDRYLIPFIEKALEKNISEIGISEHSHGFKEFEKLYRQSLIINNTKIGRIQRKWLKQHTKFRAWLNGYGSFVSFMRIMGLPVKTGIEVCNLNDQNKVGEILDEHSFDYTIGSVHFINGWGFDLEKKFWKGKSVNKIYKDYAKECIRMCDSGNYDILGHAFNVRLFKIFPTTKMKKLYEKVAQAVKRNKMVVEINTGTLNRYPIKEITPNKGFMKVVADMKIPITFASDAHHAKDVGYGFERAVKYAKNLGYKKFTVFNNRRKSYRKL